MKIKFFTLLVCCILAVSCSKEDTNKEETLLELDNGYGTGILTTGSGCPDVVCDINYVFPTPDGSLAITMQIHYDPEHVAVEDIPCIRQEYFECFGDILGLTFPIVQPNDPFHEVWKRSIGKPGTAINTAQCNDPRFADSAACQD